MKEVFLPLKILTFVSIKGIADVIAASAAL